MNTNPATAAQLLALHTLEMKRLEPVANQEAVKDAVKRPEHPFWELYEAAIATLIVVVEDVKQVVESVMKKIMEITTPAIGQKKTSGCFTEARYYHRDPDLDGWLPEIQSDQPASKFLVNELTKSANFKEVAEEIIGEKGDVKKLSQQLIQRRYTTTLPTIESLIERQEGGGGDVGLRTDGYANLFFVEGKDGGVSVVLVYRNDRQWYVYVNRLDHDFRWPAEDRVFIRNS